jgi:hypothetical protein
VQNAFVFTGMLAALFWDDFMLLNTFPEVETGCVSETPPWFAVLLPSVPCCSVKALDGVACPVSGQGELRQDPKRPLEDGFWPLFHGCFSEYISLFSS